MRHRHCYPCLWLSFEGAAGSLAMNDVSLPVRRLLFANNRRNCVGLWLWLSDGYPRIWNFTCQLGTLMNPSAHEGNWNNAEDDKINMNPAPASRTNCLLS
jgi:hypothetical protein